MPTPSSPAPAAPQVVVPLKDVGVQEGDKPALESAASPALGQQPVPGGSPPTSGGGGGSNPPISGPSATPTVSLVRTDGQWQLVFTFPNTPGGHAAAQSMLDQLSKPDSWLAKSLDNVVLPSGGTATVDAALVYV